MATFTHRLTGKQIVTVPGEFLYDIVTLDEAWTEGAAGVSPSDEPLVEVDTEDGAEPSE